MTLDTRAQVARLLNPASVAVIGASEDQAKFGGRAIHLLLKHGFPGEVYPVNPNRSTIFGRRAWPSVTATPRPADVALLAIPRPYLRAAIEECAGAGVGAAIVITAQFAEVGEAGAREEREIVGIAREAGMRLLGPNCLGFFSPANGVVLSTSPALDIERLRPGAVALVSQSGALLATVFDRANDLGIGFSRCVSVGNQADLSADDIVDYLIDDERTRVICSYVEGFKEPARTLALAARAREAGKPWLMVKAGRSAVGGRAALSHTASLAGDYAVLEAVARDAGITLLDDPDAMILAAATMLHFDLAPIRRLAIVTTSGGGGALAADRLTDAGVELARFAPETTAALDPLFMPGQAGNPVDLGGRRAGEAVDVAEGALGAVASDPAVDCSLIALSTAPLLDQIARNLASAAMAAGKPYLFVLWPGAAADASRQALLELGAPFCDRLDDAVRAVRAWRDWSAQAPLPAEPRPAGLPDVATLLDRLPAGPLGEAATKELLAACGVPVNAGRLATTPDGAVAIADDLGYPVALKIAAAGLTHKSDIGGVVLDLDDEPSLRAAWTRLADNVARAAPDVTLDGMLTQRMARGDAELIVGVKRDPQFGPIVLVGAGGMLVELLRDTQLARTPLGPRAAEALLRRLRAWPLLAGARGRPPLDTAAVADIVSRVSWLAWEARARLVELDINPLLVAEDGAIAVDARAALRDERLSLDR